MHENVFPGGMPVEGKRGNYIALAATLAALGALLLCSQAALESARAGLNLCAQMIVPSLLPFSFSRRCCSSSGCRASSADGSPP